MPMINWSYRLKVDGSRMIQKLYAFGIPTEDKIVILVVC